jgi:Ferredoxin-like domain in Api92-like protein
MPNHIKNRIKLLGSFEQVDAIIKAFSTKQDAYVSMTHDDELAICIKKDDDFGVCWMNLRTGICQGRKNEIIQNGIPDGFELEIKNSLFLFPDFKKVIPPPDNDAYNDRPSQDAVKHLPDWWYTWNTKHWGSKWGGYGYEQEAINIFTFETAWSSAIKIIDKMASAFPEVLIEYEWADEDTSRNCGKRQYKNGKLVNEYIPEGGSIEAYELAFSLRPEYRKDYELVDGGYKYK